MTSISSDLLRRLQANVEPGERARFQLNETVIEFVPAAPHSDSQLATLNAQPAEG